MNILLVFPGFIVAFIILFYYERKIRELKNNVHFYLASDADGKLLLYISKPVRVDDTFESDGEGCCLTCNIEYYGLKYEDYYYLNWEYKPVEVFVNTKD